MIGDGRWVRDRENHHLAEQFFPGMEAAVGKGGLKSHSPALSQTGACGRPRQVLRVLSCRTATVWKTLCPFWGEEYQVHLLPTFHSVAFYVMDEDALRWVEPQSSAGAQTPPLVPLWPISLLGLLVTASSVQPGGRGSPGGSGRCRVWMCGVCVCVCGFLVLPPHHACARALGCVCAGMQARKQAPGEKSLACLRACVSVHARKHIPCL